MVETNRCRLSKLQECDYDDVKKLYMNEEVRKFLGGTIADEKTFKAKFFDVLENSNRGSLDWVIRATSNDEFIGLITLDRHHDGMNTEVSYQLLPNWWGDGYATEVISQIIRYAFQEMGLPKVIAETQTANKSSCKLLERVGMKLEQTVQRYGAEQAIYSIELSDVKVR